MAAPEAPPNTVWSGYHRFQASSSAIIVSEDGLQVRNASATSVAVPSDCCLPLHGLERRTEDADSSGDDRPAAAANFLSQLSRGAKQLVTRFNSPKARPARTLPSSRQTRAKRRRAPAGQARKGPTRGRAVPRPRPRPRQQAYCPAACR